MTRDELLTDIRRDHATLEALVASLSETRLAAPELDEGWSAKDVLAHISAWERLCVKWIGAGRREEGPFTRESIDTFNRGIYEANRELSPKQALQESRASYEAMIQTIEGLTGDLDAPPPWRADEFTDGTATATLGQTIRANSDEHYREHIGQLEGWLKRS